MKMCISWISNVDSCNFLLPTEDRTSKIRPKNLYLLFLCKYFRLNICLCFLCVASTLHIQSYRQNLPMQLKMLHNLDSSYLRRVFRLTEKKMVVQDLKWKFLSMKGLNNVICILHIVCNMLSISYFHQNQNIMRCWSFRWISNDATAASFTIYRIVYQTSRVFLCLQNIIWGVGWNVNMEFLIRQEWGLTYFTLHIYDSRQ